MLTHILIFVLTLFAGFIQRVSGFGFGIFVMMFFPLFLPSYGESTTLSGLLAGSTALIIAIRYFRHIRWNIMLPLLVTNIIASYIAIEYMASMSSSTLKRSFGAMFVAIALYFLFFENRVRLAGNGFVKTALGILSGIMGGMFAMPGPPIVLCCINIIKENIAYIATLQAFSVRLNVFYTLFRAKAGFLGEEHLIWWSVGITGAAIGSMVGAKVFSCLNSRVLKRTVYILLLVSGIISMI